jgi:hypothetical protein
MDTRMKTTIRASLVEVGLRRVLNDSQAKTKPAFKLKDTSACGGELLISDPRKWRQLEDEHLAASLVIPTKAGIHNQ